MLVMETFKLHDNSTKKHAFVQDAQQWSKPWILTALGGDELQKVRLVPKKKPQKLFSHRFH